MRSPGCVLRTLRLMSCCGNQAKAGHIYHLIPTAWAPGVQGAFWMAGSHSSTRTRIGVVCCRCNARVSRQPLALHCWDSQSSKKGPDHQCWMLNADVASGIDGSSERLVGWSYHGGDAPARAIAGLPPTLSILNRSRKCKALTTLRLISTTLRLISAMCWEQEELEAISAPNARDFGCVGCRVQSFSECFDAERGPLCSVCHASSFACKECRQPITGQYFEALGEKEGP